MFSNWKMKEVLVVIFVVFMIELIISGPTIIDVLYLLLLLFYFIKYKMLD